MSGHAYSCRRSQVPQCKSNITPLQQAHFQRTNLSGDLATDQAKVLSTTIRLLQAAVDVITSSSWLNPAITAMELSQMVVQAMWQTDSVLLQLPHFTRDLAKKCTQANVSTIIASQEEGSSLADMEVSMLCCAVLCCAVLCCAVLCCAVLCCAVLCGAVRCGAVLCFLVNALLCQAVSCTSRM